MINSAFFQHTRLCFFVALIFVITVPRVHAQSLLGIRVGDSSQQLKVLGSPPANTDTYKSYIVQKWILPNSDEFSATAEQSGQISYLELDWGGKSSRLACDLPGIILGVTTLTDIRKRFGSNGFGFENRDGVIRIPEGVIMLNSYEVGNAVITFYTKALQDKSAQGNQMPVADRAKLDGISIADSDYAVNGWGKRISDPNYTKPAWK